MAITSLEGAINFLKNLESYQPKNELEAAVIRNIYERRLETNLNSLDAALALQEENNNIYDEIQPTKSNTEVIFETQFEVNPAADEDAEPLLTIDFEKLKEINQEYDELRASKKAEENGADFDEPF